ncbi:MAG: DUF4160 domain-containing protein [Deltaproteobacteria bacterium]|nr:DUF4160 domain-containing protein [Deltaproteobacteria bacterium]
MPAANINISGPYRFFFCSFDCNEPMHVHVQREKSICKFWIQPMALANNHGFSAKELNGIRKIITAHKDRIMEAWHEHCGSNTGRAD